MTTRTVKQSEIKRVWHHIDLNGQVLGRVSSQIAEILIGKHKPYYSPNLDCGDYVVVTNAAGITITGRKATQKLYYRHSNYPGGFKEVTFTEQMQKDPRKVITHAIKGMLPKNKLQAPRLKRLKVFVGTEHPYADKLATK